MALFLALLAGGILLLASALITARNNWRPDIEPYGRQHFLFHIVMHPERYTKPESLCAIRLLSLAGAALICGALLIVVLDIL